MTEEQIEVNKHVQIARSAMRMHIINKTKKDPEAMKRVGSFLSYARLSLEQANYFTLIVATRFANNDFEKH